MVSDYHQCKVCDGEIAEPTWNATPSPTVAAVPAPTGLAELRGRMPRWEFGTPPHEAEWLINVAMYAMGTKVELFVAVWMELLSRKARKDFSYHGAVRCRTEADPKHFRCHDTGVEYFDPGNSVYGMALSALAPECCRREHWNNETKGDIMEGVMGCSYLKDYYTRQNETMVCEAAIEYGQEARQVANLFEEIAWRTHALTVRVGHDKLLPWVNWVMSNVYFAKTGACRVDVLAEVEADTLVEQMGPKERLNHLWVKLT